MYFKRIKEWLNRHVAIISILGVIIALLGFGISFYDLIQTYVIVPNLIIEPVDIQSVDNNNSVTFNIFINNTGFETAYVIGSSAYILKNGKKIPVLHDFNPKKDYPIHPGERKRVVVTLISASDLSVTIEIIYNINKIVSQKVPMTKSR